MFYDIFSQLCKSKGVTPSRACLDMNLSRSLGAKWKNTRANPSYDVLLRMSDYFEVSIDYLLGNTEQKEKPTAKSDELVNEIDQKIIDLLKKLNPRDKAAIMAQIDALANLPSDKED